MPSKLDIVLKTIIAESAGEGPEGMYAVASAIANRSIRRGKTPVEIVNQPKQFSGRWRKDLDAFIAAQPPQILQAAQVAWQKAQTDPLPGLDHFVTLDKEKSTYWTKEMGGRRVIGNHVFFDSQSKPPSPQALGDPIEQGMRRINKMTVAFGLDPLNAQEINGILGQVESPTALPGVKWQAPDPKESEQRAISAMAKLSRPGQGGAMQAFQGVS